MRVEAVRANAMHGAPQNTRPPVVSMVTVRAPMSINLGGDGTDRAAYYGSFGGFVVNAAIDRYCYVVAREPARGGVRISWANAGVWEDVDPDQPTEAAGALQLPKAAVEWFADKGLPEIGVDLFLSSELLPAVGLGASSALAAALVQALSTYVGVRMHPYEIAKVVSRLEVERLGMSIGEQGEYAAALGGINAMTFRTEGVDVDPLDLADEVMERLSNHLLLFWAERCRKPAYPAPLEAPPALTEPIVTKSLHELKALAREMQGTLLQGDVERFGALLDIAWRYDRQLSGASPDVVDRWYGAARKAGATGGKVTEAVDECCLLLSCPPARHTEVRAAMARFGLREIPFGIDWEGARVLAVTEQQGRRSVQRSLTPR